MVQYVMKNITNEVMNKHIFNSFIFRTIYYIYHLDIYLLPNLSAKIGCDTKSISKWN